MDTPQTIQSREIIVATEVTLNDQEIEAACQDDAPPMTPGVAHRIR